MTIAKGPQQSSQATEPSSNQDGIEHWLSDLRADLDNDPQAWLSESTPAEAPADEPGRRDPAQQLLDDADPATSWPDDIAQAGPRAGSQQSPNPHRPDPLAPEFVPVPGRSATGNAPYAAFQLPTDEPRPARPAVGRHRAED